MPERNEPIPRALTVGEWVAAFRSAAAPQPDYADAIVRALAAGRWHAAMALANATLAAGDRGRVTHDHVELLRAECAAAEQLGQPERARAMDALADVLEAILPPWVVS